MAGKHFSRDLRELIVNHRAANKGATYSSMATQFHVGTATISRLLRLKRETGDVVPRAAEAKRPHKLDRGWLTKHVANYPDATLKDRARSYATEKHISVGLSGVWYALTALGFTHKKKRFTPSSVTPNG
jgi:transposase